MTHLSEETLVELQLGDAGPSVEADTHLADCAECRARRDEIAETLAAASALSVPERGEDYGAAVWSRLEPRLVRPTFGRKVVRRFPAFVGLAAALVGAFYLGRHTSTPVAPVAMAPAAPTPSVVRERILLVAVGEHLDRSQMVLIELANASASPEGVNVAAERAVASELVGEGRLFRQAALRTSEPGVADVLDDLERLQKRIESQGLLFKVRVVGARVREREQDAVRAQVDVQS